MHASIGCDRSRVRVFFFVVSDLSNVFQLFHSFYLQPIVRGPSGSSRKNVSASCIRELYKLLLGRFNTHMADDARLIPRRNGFETRRQIAQNRNPTLENSDFAMGWEIQTFASKSAQSLA